MDKLPDYFIENYIIPYLSSNDLFYKFRTLGSYYYYCARNKILTHFPGEMMKTLQKIIEFNTRKELIQAVKPSRFDYSCYLPFNVSDGMVIDLVRGTPKWGGYEGLGLRFAKEGTHFYCSYYDELRKNGKTDFFAEKEFKEFYRLIKGINHPYVIINIEKYCERDKDVLKFINKIKSIFPNTTVKVKLEDSIRLFN